MLDQAYNQLRALLMYHLSYRDTTGHQVQYIKLMMILLQWIGFLFLKVNLLVDVQLNNLVIHQMDFLKV